MAEAKTQLSDLLKLHARRLHASNPTLALTLALARALALPLALTLPLTEERHPHLHRATHPLLPLHSRVRAHEAEQC